MPSVPEDLRALDLAKPDYPKRTATMHEVREFLCIWFQINLATTREFGMLMAARCNTPGRSLYAMRSSNFYDLYGAVGGDLYDELQSCKEGKVLIHCSIDLSCAGF